MGRAARRAFRLSQKHPPPDPGCKRKSRCHCLHRELPPSCPEPSKCQADSLSGFEPRILVSESRGIRLRGESFSQYVSCAPATPTILSPKRVPYTFQKDCDYENDRQHNLYHRWGLRNRPGPRRGIAKDRLDGARFIAVAGRSSGGVGVYVAHLLRLDGGVLERGPHAALGAQIVRA